MKINNRRGAELAMMIGAFAGLALPDVRRGIRGGAVVIEPDEMQQLDEKNFLATLEGEPRRIWSRRIRRGLSNSELEFIREKLKG